MNSLLIIASVIALAVAGPTHRGLVTPGGAGPAPAPETEPISVGPAILDFEPVAIGPAIIEGFEPVAIGPAVIGEFEPVSVGPAFVEEPINVPTSPVVQIILNINGVSHVIDTPIAAPAEMSPLPVQVVESAPEPIQVVEVAPEPIQVIEQAPEPIQVIETAPVVIGTPVLPSPVVVMPEPLN